MYSWDEHWYWEIGGWAAGAAWFVSFLASWWYCAATYGYLLGFGLGWLPSLILASILGIATKLLWGPALLLAGYGALELFKA
jgi:hypothetical protein